MTRKEKPVLAGTKTRAIKTRQVNVTPSSEVFQCPCCKLSGRADLFVPGWPDQLFELLARNPGLGISGHCLNMDYQEARYLYNRLLRHER
jgi:hypothetical protein